jgi:hypothetical protein
MGGEGVGDKNTPQQLCGEAHHPTEGYDGTWRAIIADPTTETPNFHSIQIPLFSWASIQIPFFLRASKSLSYARQVRASLVETEKTRTEKVEFSAPKT